MQPATLLPDADPYPSAPEGLTDLVDPTIDSANSRWIHFASAGLPFGLVKLQPDTQPDGDWRAGYRWDIPWVTGFSHVHDWQLAGVPVLPVVGRGWGPKGRDQYRRAFDHADERVRPGYHAVTLRPDGTRCELTATTRCGFHRYRFSARGEAEILIDLGAAIGPLAIDRVRVEQTGPRELTCELELGKTIRRPMSVPLFAVIRWDCDATVTWWQRNDTRGLMPTVIEGEQIGVALAIEECAGLTVQMQVGLSYVDAAGARANVSQELPDWDFAACAQRARQAWRDALDIMAIEGGTTARRTKFATDIWHSFLGRGVRSDADGRWSEFTGPLRTIRQVPCGANGLPTHHHHDTDAVWHGYWNINGLWPLLRPQVVDHFCRFLMDMYDAGGFIPRGPSGGRDTFVMTSAPVTALMVGAWMKGIRPIEGRRLFAALKKNHLPGGLMSKAGYEHTTAHGGGLEQYISKGWIAEGLPGTAFHRAGAGQTLEHAFNDWCLAQLAQALGLDADVAEFTKRSRNWANLYDQETGFIRPRAQDGSWITPFRPDERTGFVEANSYHATWIVPHDLPGLAKVMGGAPVAAKRLNEQFERMAHLAYARAMHVDDKECYHNCTTDFGNEPCGGMAHAFHFLGRSDLACHWVREVLDKTYSGTTPQDGWHGDEDQGMLGSLAGLMAIGLFHQRGGCDQGATYELTAPVFERITIALDQRYVPGQRLRIVAVGAQHGWRHIKSVTLDGKPLESLQVGFADLVKGDTELRFELCEKPERQWPATI